MEAITKYIIDGIENIKKLKIRLKNYAVYGDTKIVFKYDTGKLFKGHHGSVVTTPNSLKHVTSLYNYSCTQIVTPKKGKLKLDVMHYYYFKPTYWLINKQEAFLSLLAKNKGLNLSSHFMCENENYKFDIGYSPVITYCESFDDCLSMYTHSEMIDFKEELRRKGRKILDVIKKMSDEEFYEEVISYNKELISANEKKQSIGISTGTVMGCVYAPPILINFLVN